MFLFIRIRLKQEIGFQEQEREKSRLRLAVSKRESQGRFIFSRGWAKQGMGPVQGAGKLPGPTLGCKNSAVAMGKVTFEVWNESQRT